MKKLTPEEALASVTRRFPKYCGPQQPNGCILWTGAASRCTANDVRGFIGWAGRGQINSHRVAYELAYGPIPPGMHVCHRCDNGLCVNPDHLFLGTPKDNVRDCVAKERNVRGLTHGRAVLTEEQVRQIRASTKKNKKALAREMGINYHTLRDAWFGYTYSSIPPANDHVAPPVRPRAKAARR